MLQQQNQKLDRDLEERMRKLNKNFPRYGELFSLEPVDSGSAQKLLAPGEALISYFTLDDRFLVWLLRKDKELLYRDMQIKKEDLKKLVGRVRNSLDQSKNTDPRLLMAFDVDGSYHLYKLLFLSFRDQLNGVKQLIIVPDEVLLPVPFAALVTRNEEESYKKLAELYEKSEKINPVDQKTLLQYRQLSWLINDYPISILPSATSLRALRQIPPPKQKETERLIAFGDPVLEGKGTAKGGLMLASRGAIVPVEEIRKLNRLPGTKHELEAVAKALKVSPTNSLYQQATKPMVVKLNDWGRLANAQVVAFATHGLISAELKGLKEPALVLTPPETPTEEDNGLLGLEDVLKFKLDSADWVVLSACNTASADGSGEGLSGLVRFFSLPVRDRFLFPTGVWRTEQRKI
jgi:CHAT domain-containing protein